MSKLKRTNFPVEAVGGSITWNMMNASYMWLCFRLIRSIKMEIEL